MPDYYAAVLLMQCTKIVIWVYNAVDIDGSY